jgi:hypothetical protein
MTLKTPPEIFHDWLGQHAKETRVSVVIDSDRFLAEAKVLDKPTVIDAAGREWQLAVFRGDDLAFRLRFRDCVTKDRTVVVLSRGPDTTEPIDVSYVADILAKNEAGEPLDFSVTAFFRRVAPKINFPTSELRRFKSELLGRIDHVEKAADKLILRWGKPDSWGRGQVAAMVLLAHHPDLNLSDIWPDETTPAEFLAHVVRLLVGTSELRPHREVVWQVIHEAARAQVSDVIFWAETDPEELAAYLVLREFAAQAKLQNPSTQLAGIQVFSPELSLSKMEPIAPEVIAALKKQPKIWGSVNVYAETFLTPKRAARILELIPSAKKISDASLLVNQESPALLRQQLLSLLLGFFENPQTKELSWVAPLENHSLLRAVELLSDRARQCCAALNLLLRLNRIEQRLAEMVPAFPHADALLDWFAGKGQHLLELELARAHHDLQECGDADEELQAKGQAYLFGGHDELSPTPSSLKGRVLARLRHLDEMLAAFVRTAAENFGHGSKSVRGFLRSKIDIGKVSTGTLPGRLWVLVFDGMRFDTWDAVVKPLFAESFGIEDAPYFCVLPSYTEFARKSLLAGVLPTEWKGFKGNFSDSESQLFAVNMGLNAQEAKSKLRFVTEADTTKARTKLNFTDKDAAPLNVLIYPVSDDACHDFGGDLASFNNKIRSDMVGNKADGVRGILDDLLKRIGPQDTVLLSSDHGFVELLASEAVAVSKAEADKANVTLETGVHWRYVEGFAPAQLPTAVAVSVSSKKVWMAPVRHWFYREGGKGAPRYTHGGLSLAEVVVPGVVLRRTTEKEARVELMDLPSVIAVDEDQIFDLPVLIRNSGNCEVEFEVRVLNNLGEELLVRRKHLGPAVKANETAKVMAKYKENSDREPDPASTVTAVTVRLRHTDVNGAWKEALDGLTTIAVKIKPKPVKLETDALKAFDDILSD